MTGAPKVLTVNHEIFNESYSENFHNVFMLAKFM